MNSSIIKEIKARTEYLQANKDTLVIDGDTHPSDLDRLTGQIKHQLETSPNYYQGKPISPDQLIMEMNAARVDMCISWQNPSVLEYEEISPANFATNFERLLEANRFIHSCARTHPERIIPCGWTDPKALGVDLARDLATICVEELGFSIVKMNPAQNEYSMNSPEILDVMEHIITLGAIPAFHFGGDSPYTMPESLEEIASRFPESRIIAVHMGGGGSHYVEGDRHYVATRKLGLSHSNLFFILSAIRDCHIESNLITYQAEGPPFINNIACGSDAPYGKVVWNFGGFRSLFSHLSGEYPHPDPRVGDSARFTDDAIQNYLGRNLANLVIDAYENILQKQGIGEKVK